MWVKHTFAQRHALPTHRRQPEPAVRCRRERVRGARALLQLLLLRCHSAAHPARAAARCNTLASSRSHVKRLRHRLPPDPGGLGRWQGLHLWRRLRIGRLRGALRDEGLLLPWGHRPRSTGWDWSGELRCRHLYLHLLHLLRGQLRLALGWQRTASLRRHVCGARSRRCTARLHISRVLQWCSTRRQRKRLWRRLALCLRQLQLLLQDCLLLELLLLQEEGLSLGLGLSL